MLPIQSIGLEINTWRKLKKKKKNPVHLNFLSDNLGKNPNSTNQGVNSQKLHRKISTWIHIAMFRAGQVLSCSVVSDSLRPYRWTVVCQSPLSMGFPWQEYWSGLPFPPPGNLLKTQGLNRCLLHWQADSLLLSCWGSLRAFKKVIRLP